MTSSLRKHAFLSDQFGMSGARSIDLRPDFLPIMSRVLG